jgi:hypothetical protein
MVSGIAAGGIAVRGIVVSGVMVSLSNHDAAVLSERIEA